MAMGWSTLSGIACSFLSLSIPLLRTSALPSARGFAFTCARQVSFFSFLFFFGCSVVVVVFFSLSLSFSDPHSHTVNALARESPLDGSLHVGVMHRNHVSLQNSAVSSRLSSLSINFLSRLSLSLSCALYNLRHHHHHRHTSTTTSSPPSLPPSPYS